jgi:hypothetical protein
MVNISKMIRISLAIAENLKIKNCVSSSFENKSLPSSI